MRQTTRRDALRETKRERMNRRAVELVAAGILTGLLPMLGIAAVDLIVAAVI